MNRRDVFSLVFAVAALPALAQGAGPVELVQEVYVRALREENVLAAGTRDRFVSRELSRLLARDEAHNERTGELGRLDFDPITASQDPDVRGLTVTSRTQTADRAIVIASFTHGEGGPRVVLRYELQRGDRGWRITDIVQEGSDGWSLRSILRQPL